jgi:hypothetical protein
MATYTVTLSDAEIRGMEHVCVDVNQWIQNAFTHKVNTAMTGLCDLEMAKAMKFQKPIVTNREELVRLSNEPPMADWVSAEDYILNPDAPFNNPLVNIDAIKE